MNYSLTIREEDFEQLQQAVFSEPSLEGAAYVLCGVSSERDEVRFLARHVIPVAQDDYLVRRHDFLSLQSKSYVTVAKQARNERCAVLFAHSHPDGPLAFSKQDDQEDPKLQDFFLTRMPDHLHGSLVLTRSGIRGRVYANGFQSMFRIRIVGRRFQFNDLSSNLRKAEKYYDRQVRAFGPQTQALLASLHVGVVGAGGTGSALIEQLTRLGVGTISIFDGDLFSESNVNRVYGSSVRDVGTHKVSIAGRSIERIGLQTQTRLVPENITKKTVAAMLRSCDIVFGCTDKQTPRAILVQLALRYLIPVIDLGVLINSERGVITDVVGRVTTLLAGEACLFCRERISADQIRLESLSSDERRSLAREGYAPELDTPAPAVIPFTTAVAAQAVTELLHRLTGFMGADRETSEVLMFFDQTGMRKNRMEPSPNCFCSNREIWARGDSTPFLGTAWAT